MSAKEKELYEFGDFRLDVAEHFLMRAGGERVPLSEKAFETLCILVRNAGHLVTKNELLKEVWADSFVEENNLNKCIHVIRRTLDEKSGKIQFIETVKKHGFRFVAEVRRIEAEAKPPDGENALYPKPKTFAPQNLSRRAEQTEIKASAKVVALADWRHEAETNQSKASNGRIAGPELTLAKPAAERRPKYRVAVLAAVALGALALGFYFYTAINQPVGDKKSFAVLPFRGINTAQREDLYEIGIADSLILRLGSINGFIVRPIDATRKYAGLAPDPLAAGREQQVDYVLVSNYQLADGKIKITAQLFNVANGQIEETYKSEKDATNAFAMQDAVAYEVGNILMTRFATVLRTPPAKRGTTNQEAYQFYLHGRNLTYNQNAANARKAIENFDQAVRLDPDFARAYAGMAHAFIAFGNLGGGLPHVEYAKARVAIEKALELDPELGEAHAVLGEYKFVCEWNFSTAEKDLLRAIELEPNSDLAHEQYASFLSARGRFNDAIAEAKTALEINPSSPWLQRELGRSFYLARRYDEAIIQFKRAFEADGNAGLLSGSLFVIYELKNDERAAFEWFMKFQEQTNPERREALQNAYEISGWQAVRRKFLEFEKLNEQKPSVNYYRLARQSVMLGDREQTFEYLYKAVEKRHGQLIMLNVEPPFDILRDDPRFDELVRRVGLSEN